MSSEMNTPVAVRLLGAWGLAENNGRAMADGVLTQTFTGDGRLITVIRDGYRVMTFHHKYRIVGDELVIDGPEEFANPNHVRTRFWFNEAGDLMTDSGQRIPSRFKRV